MLVIIKILKCYKPIYLYKAARSLLDTKIIPAVF